MGHVQCCHKLRIFSHPCTARLIRTVLGLRHSSGCRHLFWDEFRQADIGHGSATASDVGMFRGCVVYCQIPLNATPIMQACTVSNSGRQCCICDEGSYGSNCYLRLVGIRTAQ